MGCGAVCRDGRKALVLAIYLISAVLLWLFRGAIWGFDRADMLASLYRGIAGLLIPVYGIGGQAMAENKTTASSGMEIPDHAIDSIARVLLP